jgi:hypothetical protein
MKEIKKEIKEKRPPGRPSKKDSLDLGMIERLYGLGLTDVQVGKVLDVGEGTILSWKKDKKFADALKKGKAVPDKEVEVSLFKRATGYSYPDIDIRVVGGRIVKTNIVKHCPPDPTSMIFWLKNRKREEWRDRQDLAVGGVDNQPLTFRVIYQDKKEPK